MRKLYATAGAIGIALAMITWVVITTAMAHNELQKGRENPEPWSGPEIPQCEKELWLRIKDGC